METKRHKIFIVDGSVVNLEIDKHVLQAHYSVLGFLSAAVFFEALERIIPDLILLSIDLHEMNGFEVIIKLKADKKMPIIKIIIFS